MINTTDFLNYLGLFEHASKSKHFPVEIKIKLRGYLIAELEKLKDQINEVDLGEETPELFEGTNNSLKNL
jgi:hypothetical protein